MKNNSLVLTKMALGVCLGMLLAVPVRGSDDQAQSGPTSRPEEKIHHYTGRGDATNENLPSVYIVPMKGQMGTDIHSDAYEGLVEDIKALKPDLVVFEMECSDVDQGMDFTRASRGNSPEEVGLLKLEPYRHLVANLKDNLRGIPQVMWVKDSAGISSIIALSWPDMYMSSNARLAGLAQIWLAARSWSDDDIRGKMIAAWVGMGNGFLQRGGYPIELGRAMMNPEHALSATWVGRKVKWSLDTEGDYVVDGRHCWACDVCKGVHNACKLGKEGCTCWPANFNAKMAEDFLISDGTADELDDLLLLYGLREYRVLDAKGPQMVERYLKQWRRSLKNAKKLWEEYQTHLNRAGDDPRKWLGRAKGDLTKILAAMNRYEAVEIRMGMEEGINKVQLELMIAELKDRIRSLGRGGRGGRGGGRGGGGMGG